MKFINKAVRNFSYAIAAIAIFTGGAQAATFSSTKVELLYGYDYARGADFAEVDQAIFTVANATGFKWGDSFFFLDTSNFDDDDNTGGTHMEWGPRYRFWKGDGEGAIKAFYGIAQIDWDSGRFANKVTKMGGVSLDWNVPGFKFFKTHLQLRDDPVFDGTSVQLNLVWNKGFKIGEQDFSFEGFLDWTSSEGDSESNLLTQPQLVWHATKHFGVGIEYQYWKNRIGRDGITEQAPQLMARWTF